MGAVDWIRPCNVELAGGWFGWGSVQGGPFADDVMGHTFPSGRFDPNRPPIVTPGGTTQRGHDGLDLITPQGRGTILQSLGDGVVDRITVASPVNPAVGNGIAIDHGNDWRSYYTHMAYAPLFVVGQHVVQGETLGEMDSTGLSTGDHLHMMIQHRGSDLIWRAVDPLMILLAAPDIGQPLAARMIIAGDPSPALHWTQHAGLQALFGDGTVAQPLTVVVAMGDEVWHAADGVARTLVAGQLCARYELLRPLGA